MLNNLKTLKYIFHGKSEVWCRASFLAEETGNDDQGPYKITYVGECGG